MASCWCGTKLDGDISNLFYNLGMGRSPSIVCGALVRDARRRRGLDQAELARRVGGIDQAGRARRLETPHPAISRIERDAVSPTIETLNRLLEALGETL